MEVNCQLQAPVSSPLGNPGWMGPKIGLEVEENSLVPLPGIELGHLAHIPLATLYGLPRVPSSDLRYRRDGRVASGKAIVSRSM
jgi:hypothetical protein